MYYDKHEKMFPKYISHVIFLEGCHMLKLRYAYCLKKEIKFSSSYFSDVFIQDFVQHGYILGGLSLVLVWMFVSVFFINNKTVFRDVMDRVD